MLEWGVGNLLDGWETSAREWTQSTGLIERNETYLCEGFYTLYSAEFCSWPEYVYVTEEIRWMHLSGKPAEDKDPELYNSNKGRRTD